MQKQSALKLKSSPSQSSLQKLAYLLEHALKEVDQTIDHNLQSQIPLIDQITKHIIYAGGKRIRPCLTLASAQFFAPLNPAATYLATAVEFIHTATLLHDDVVDESDLRRGKPSVHQIWGNSSSILVGDFLFARAFQLMVKTNHLSVLDILSHASATIAEGEVLQLVESHNLNITKEMALKILGAKTAQLFGAACQTGAIVAGATPQQAQHFFNYGYNLGLVFQITDDVLDYTAQNDHRGKTPGDDFREGKITLPIIYAFQQATQDEKDFFDRTLIQMDQKPDDFVKIKSILTAYGSMEKTLETGAYHRDQALIELEKLEVTKQDQLMIKDLLKDIVNDCLTRTA